MSYVVPLNGETWLICGGRDFRDHAMFDSAMLDLLSLYGCPKAVVHGAARGADSMAGSWAERMALDVHPVPADWRTHGLSAGPIRNTKMLNEYKPQRVIAFPGGKGTANMIAQARKRNVTVIEIKPN